MVTDCTKNLRLQKLSKPVYREPHQSVSDWVVLVDVCMLYCFYIKEISHFYHIFRSKPRNGTCFTSTECNEKGGTVSGNCAAG